MAELGPAVALISWTVGGPAVARLGLERVASPASPIPARAQICRKAERLISPFQSLSDASAIAMRRRRSADSMSHTSYAGAPVGGGIIAGAERQRQASTRVIGSHPPYPILAAIVRWVARRAFSFVPEDALDPRDVEPIARAPQHKLATLNARIAELLADLNARPMRLYRASRRELFERLDHPALRPLPAEPFVYGEWKIARVNVDYHVELHGHYYSVPYALVHE